MSPPQPTRESGERRKLPDGRAPAEKRVLEYLELEKTHLLSLPLTFPGFPGEWSPCVNQTTVHRHSKQAVSVNKISEHYTT